jgi:hypothetical protein
MEDQNWIREIDRTCDLRLWRERLEGMIEGDCCGFQIFWKSVKGEVARAQERVFEIGVSDLIDLQVRERESQDSDGSNRFQVKVSIREYDECIRDYGRKIDLVNGFVEQMNKISEQGFSCQGLEYQIFFSVFEEIQNGRDIESFFPVFQILMEYKKLFEDLPEVLKALNLTESVIKTLKTITRLESECKKNEIYKNAFLNDYFSCSDKSFISKLHKMFNSQFTPDSLFNHPQDLFIKIAKYLVSFNENINLDSNIGKCFKSFIENFQVNPNLIRPDFNTFEFLQKTFKKGLKKGLKVSNKKVTDMKNNLTQKIQEKFSDLKEFLSNQFKNKILLDLSSILNDFENLQKKNFTETTEYLLKIHSEQKEELSEKISKLLENVKSKEREISVLKEENNQLSERLKTLSRTIEEVQTNYVKPFIKMKSDKEIIERNNSSLSITLSQKDKEYQNLLIQKQEIEKKFKIEIHNLEKSKEFLEHKITESKISQDLQDFLKAVEKEQDLKNQLLAKERIIKKLLAEKKNEFSSFHQLTVLVKALEQENKSLKTQLESALFFNISSNNFNQ